MYKHDQQYSYSRTASVGCVRYTLHILNNSQLVSRSRQARPCIWRQKSNVMVSDKEPKSHGEAKCHR